MIKTVSLTADTETKVEISGGYNVGVINRTTDMLYASRNSGISAGADDVAAIPAGDSYVIRAADDTVYLLATAAGDVQLESIGVTEVFRIAAARSSSGGGEGGTVDEVARQAISSHANNDEIHLTTEKAIKAAATTISNPNLLINPDFKINQRGKSGTITDTGYFVDGWQLVSGSVTVNLDGTLTLNGTIKQILENAVDSNTTVSANAGTPSYDNSTKTFTLTAAGEIIKWAKLELGSVATPFTPPDTATELAKCQRYYQTHELMAASCYGWSEANNLSFFLANLGVPMRIKPSVEYDYVLQLQGGDESEVLALSGAPYGHSSSAVALVAVDIPDEYKGCGIVIQNIRLSAEL